ncbi:hypothetical protein HDU83_003419 [Entophlyctis luteolus]|nr:hypothetical protein HDU83_003419 [Entophlyctis luteolus]
MNERIPDTWIQPDPPITTGQMAAVAVQIYDQIETTIPDIFYVQFFLVYLAIILGPAILILHYSATKTEKLLGIRFQKSKKLALYVIYVIPEFISFVLLAVSKHERL